jgi:hypothetical protein
VKLSAIALSVRLGAFAGNITVAGGLIAHGAGATAVVDPLQIAEGLTVAGVGVRTIARDSGPRSTCPLRSGYRTTKANGPIGQANEHELLSDNVRDQPPLEGVFLGVSVRVRD